MDKKKIKILSGVAVGAILGFSYYFFIGCKSGTCAITSSPYISTAYGALIGLVFMWPAKDKAEKRNTEDHEEN
ncbi:MAG: DUF6132 family protein [Candidatus Marinimicrobia bacterium]|nr:DUF6132 family protein [Candidatus Neomarinimicrobiota bacterium]MCF7850790.1 DUF6132 family protein [Candidatus Neomarinimicrobiota bacterium]MCF7904800.1 DUF6132 family protein [Candidatus Neomarinimicrobiota bacterium]